MPLADIIINILLIVLSLSVFSLFKRHVPDHFLSFGFCILNRMEATVDMEFPEGVGPEHIVKELAQVANGGVIQTFLFRSPYPMHAHGSEENGLNWDDGHIPYDQLHTVLNVGATPFDHLYAYKTKKCENLNRHTKRPVHNLED